jgi:hypothetical protein
LKKSNSERLVRDNSDVLSVNATAGRCACRVGIFSYAASCADNTLATVWLDDDGCAMVDDEGLFERWNREGIIGRSSSGRLFPRDGLRFLVELPFAFRSPAFFAKVLEKPASHGLSRNHD